MCWPQTRACDTQCRVALQDGAESEWSMANDNVNSGWSFCQWNDILDFIIQWIYFGSIWGVQLVPFTFSKVGYQWWLVIMFFMIGNIQVHISWTLTICITSLPDNLCWKHNVKGNRSWNNGILFQHNVEHTRQVINKVSDCGMYCVLNGVVDLII